MCSLSSNFACSLSHLNLLPSREVAPSLFLGVVVLKAEGAFVVAMSKEDRNILIIITVWILSLAAALIYL